VILFTADNGLLMGEFGMGGKGLLYDLTAKEPCFVYDPRLPKKHRGCIDTHLVSCLDHTKTILDYAGVSAPSQLEGKSLLGLLNGQLVLVRRAARTFSRATRGMSPAIGLDAGLRDPVGGDNERSLPRRKKALSHSLPISIPGHGAGHGAAGPPRPTLRGGRAIQPPGARSGGDSGPRINDQYILVCFS
jgi:hypothetical protein